jgi:predicted DNA-binding transcriptional regulator AlpA
VADKPRRGDILPRSLQPIGLSRETAAAYIAVSPTLFDDMVKDGRMPKPKEINSRRVWDRRKIERAFAVLPGDESSADEEWEVE